MRWTVFLMIASTVLLLGFANCIWQNVHCGTPIGCTDPLQVVPCEPVEKITAEMKDLTERAKGNGP